LSSSESFFIDERLHFFRPLTGKYREQVMACLRALYARLYSSLADYSRLVQRDLVLEVFQEAITRTPVLDASEDDTALPVRGDREQASWMLNLLLEYGWLERHVDEVTLTSTYAFSRIGRLFTQPMHELQGGRFRTRHRNTRNTCNALRSFLGKPEHEASDLLDAYEYSERIVSDFSDVIAELEERKRELIRDVEAQQLVQRASEEFFDFMEKRFMPDLAVRFSEDSVIKYREELDGLLRRARMQRRETKAAVERELRRLAPELVTDQRASVYMQILNQIENRLHSAADTMLPALRNSLHSFTRRADILLRQLSFSEASQHLLLDAFDELVKQTPEQQEQALVAAAEHMAVLEVGFVDPDHLKLYNIERRRIVNRSTETVEDDREARRRLFVEQALERAFTVNNRQLRDYLVESLAGGHEVRTSSLPVRDARELLYAAHAIEAGAASWNSDAGYRFEVIETGNRLRTEYYDAMDEFIIRVVETRPSASIPSPAMTGEG
jgi:predicted CopG family antitoxin